MRIPYFCQETLYTCAAASARMILAAHGMHKPEEEIVKDMGITPEKGCSIRTIVDYLTGNGLQVRHFKNLEGDLPAIALVNRDIYDDTTPRIYDELGIIAQWETKDIGHSGHYILLYEISGQAVSIYDPHENIGISELSLDTFLEAWSGHIIGLQ